MNVAWTMLANYAEDNGGLLYLQGATWDTINVGGPLVGGPPGVFAAMRGFYVARLAFHQTEAGRDHEFEIVIVEEDGAEVARVNGAAHVEKTPGVPANWSYNVNIVAPVTGIPLPHPGQYNISLLVDAVHRDDLPFRVIKGF